nr:hypothetical protein [Streptomyces actinomycinicus]
MSCQYSGISWQAYYTWYHHSQAEDVEGLRIRSKTPDSAPTATAHAVTAAPSSASWNAASVKGGGQVEYRRPSIRRGGLRQGHGLPDAR